EIRRIGKHPRIVEVLLVVNGLGKPFGHPVYHPIYKAAADVGLPIAIHIGGDLSLPAGSQTVAGGIVGNRFERHVLHLQTFLHHVLSFITHGFFERIPQLLLLLVEAGAAWIPWLMREADAQVPSLRRESPWVKRLPSEYFRNHVRVTTQPLDQSPHKGQLIQL